MANTPTDIANQSLDAIGVDATLGDIEEGGRIASIVLRAYRECLRQLLRGAHWDFARKQTALAIVADATNSTPNIGTNVADVAFLYEYLLPTDCVKARFVPWNPSQAPGAPAGNIVPVNAQAPLTAAPIQSPAVGMRLQPAPFLLGTDFNLPNAAQGQAAWDTPHSSPQGTTVVMTNVRNAQLIYTAAMLYPSNWDAMFRAAFVAYLAQEIALAVITDKKLALPVRKEQIEIVRGKVTQARITDGNEGFYSTSHYATWLAARRRAGIPGGFAPWGHSGPYGVMGYGWDSLTFSDGSTF